MVALALGAAALGASIYGTTKQVSAAKKQTAAMQQQIQMEQQAEALRMQQMELEAKRRNKEILRNQQRARSMALAAATVQNAGQGSGLQGGYGGISGQANTQLLSTGQNLEIGRGLFAANQGVSSARMAYAAAGSDMALGRGISSLGASLQQATPMLTNMYGNLTSGVNMNPYGIGVPRASSGTRF